MSELQPLYRKTVFPKCSQAQLTPSTHERQLDRSSCQAKTASPLPFGIPKPESVRSIIVTGLSFGLLSSYRDA